MELMTCAWRKWQCRELVHLRFWFASRRAESARQISKKSTSERYRHHASSGTRLQESSCASERGCADSTLESGLGCIITCRASIVTPAAIELSRSVHSTNRPGSRQDSNQPE